MTHDEFREYKKGYYLQEKNEVENIYINHMHEETFQQNSKFEVFDRNKTSDVHGLLNEIEIVYQLKLCHVF